MQRPSPAGQLLFVLELGPAAGKLAAPRLATTCDTVLQACLAARLPATWCVSNGKLLADWQKLSGEEADPRAQGHEVALLATPDWHQPQRALLARGLQQRLEVLRGSGLSIETLVARQPFPSEHSDLLVKQGVSALCQLEPPDESPRQPGLLGRLLGATGSAAQGVSAPVGVRWGVWQLTGRLTLPGSRRAVVQRAMELAARQGSVCVVSLDIAEIATNAGAAHDFIRLTESVARLRLETGALPSTISQVVSRAMPRRNAAAQSILRRAA